MVLPIVIFLNWVWHRLLLLLFIKMPRFSDRLLPRNSPPSRPPVPSSLSFPSFPKCSLHGRDEATLVCDVHGGILRTPSFFPFFMLVAFEGGGILRAFALLLSCSFLWVLDHESQLRVMIFVTFCGLRLKDVEGVSRAVLPKFYLENIDGGVYDVLSSVGRRVVFTSVPRVMVEGFLREYLAVSGVVGTELGMCGEYFTGLVAGSGLVVRHHALKEYFGDSRPDIGLGSTSFHDHLFMSLCKVV
ncbi:hypothetical protein MLD38_009224 [Melastoma candidum]|uniref:Uncharacterized protein n=1 Tax=Melastoma candidum TaxID=119954 RepID=A0ACB9RWL1_9MYRT|nr:hypothetical protein MLD38_009224 [Melastoma candidum]